MIADGEMADFTPRVQAELVQAIATNFSISAEAVQIAVSYRPSPRKAGSFLTVLAVSISTTVEEAPALEAMITKTSAHEATASFENVQTDTGAPIIVTQELSPPVTSDGALSNGSIVGIVFGSLVGLVLIVGLVYKVIMSYLPEEPPPSSGSIMVKVDGTSTTAITAD